MCGTLKLFLYFFCFYPNLLYNAELKAGSQQVHGMNEWSSVFIKNCKLLVPITW